MHNKIGVATSIFAQNGYDVNMTLEFAKKQKLGAIQLYMDKKLEASMERITEINEQCQTQKLSIICHSPHYLNKKAVDGKHVAALHHLFPRGQKNYTVLHFDENTSTTEALQSLESINRGGITVALENYYQHQTQAGLVKNLNRYRHLIMQAKSEQLDLIPVLDLPRLFVQPFQQFNPTFLSELLIELVSHQKVILHMIDTKDAQQRREDWVPIGEGLLPYIYLFNLMKQYQLHIEYAILEFEEASLAQKSIKPLSDLLATLK